MVLNMKTNWHDISYLIILIFSIFLILIAIANADSNTVNVKILSIENIGNNLEVNASFFYMNGTPYTGSVALKSTAPPGFQPSTQDWEYIPSDGLKTFLIQNRQLQDYDSITVYAEPYEQYNSSWYGNSSWISPLDNTTVNQTINQSTDNTTVNISVNTTANTTVPVIVTTNTTNTTVIINTDDSGNGNGSVVVNNSKTIETSVDGSITGGDPSDPDSYTGYKSAKTEIFSPHPDDGGGCNNKKCKGYACGGSAATTNKCNKESCPDKLNTCNDDNDSDCCGCYLIILLPVWDAGHIGPVLPNTLYPLIPLIGGLIAGIIKYIQFRRFKP